MNERRVLIEFCEDIDSAITAIEFWTKKRKFRLVGKSELADSVTLITSKTKGGKYEQGGGTVLHNSSETDVIVLAFEEVGNEN